MRISWKNVLRTAELSATNESLTKPVENIVHNYLELYFAATIGSTTITADLDDEYALDHVAYGFHNLDTMQLKLYDIADVLLDTIDVVLEEPNGFFYFDSTVADVAKIEIIMTSSASYLYIGSISIGGYLELKNFRQGPKITRSLKGTGQESASGQFAGNKQGVLDNISLIFPKRSMTEAAEINEMLDEIENVIPVFVDFYPDRHDAVDPWYCHISLNEVPFDKRIIADFDYDVTLEFRECK
jgi:hypothetical protein